MARKFLYIVAVLIGLVIAAAFSYRLWGDALLRLALVPGQSYTAPPPRSSADYADARLWLVHGRDGAIPLPTGAPALPLPKQKVAVFFVHPTSYINRAAWNAPATDDDATAKLTQAYMDMQATAFAGFGPLWAPQYRQATFGAFLTDQPEKARALDAAYRDVAAAFDAFLAANPNGPILLAGHSQGALHLMRLMAEKVAGKPVAQRIVAAYLVGWPVSVSADLPALGLPACATPAQSGCILSWQSFAAPAGAGYVLRPFEDSTGYAHRPRRGTGMLCVNPLTGTQGTARAANSLGMIRRDEKSGREGLVRPGPGAACNAQGLLMLDGMPDAGSYVLPGNNYHVYDYALFWPNIRADAARRIAAFPAR